MTVAKIAVFVLGKSPFFYLKNCGDAWAKAAEIALVLARSPALQAGGWLGGGVIALPGVAIGGGSVIGARNVVTKDILPNFLTVGNPCHVVRKINVEI